LIGSFYLFDASDTLPINRYNNYLYRIVRGAIAAVTRCRRRRRRRRREHAPSVVVGSRTGDRPGSRWRKNLATQLLLKTY